MNKKVLFFGSLAVLLTALIGVSAVDAYQLEQKQSSFALDPDKKAEIEAHREAIKEALANNDYAAWAELVSQRPRGEKLLEIINANNFARFVEMHNLIQAGDHEGARAIAEELGLPKKPLKKFRRGVKKMMEHQRFLDNNGDGVCDMNDIEKAETEA